jgi:hypothetical protein
MNVAPNKLTPAEAERLAELIATAIGIGDYKVVLDVIRETMEQKREPL